MRFRGEEMRNKLIAIFAAILIAGAAIAGDTLQSGADNTSNTMEGPIVYARMMKYDGTYWDRVNAAPVFAGAAPSNCASITASSQQFTVGAYYYEICAHGNAAYILAGENPTATTTAGSGYDFVVPEGTCTQLARYTAAKLAWIGSSAAGSICFKAYSGI